MRKVKEDFGYSLTNVHTCLRSVAGPANLGVLKRMCVPPSLSGSPYSLCGADPSLRAAGWTG